VTARTTGWLAWSLWALAMVLEVAAIALWLANHAVLLSRPGTADDFVPHVFLVPGYATVGAVIAARRRNRIGWLFLAFGLLAALLSFGNTYFMRGAIVTPGSLPAARVAVWAGTVMWPSGYLFLALLLLLFPDGRLPSPRWRPVALVLAVSWSVAILYSAFAPATTVANVTFPNPVGIQALGHPTWKAVAQGAAAVAVATLAAAALGPLLRFRRGDPAQRQQLKWFAFVIVVSVVTLLVALAVGGALPVVATMLWGVAVAGVLVGLPAAVGLAILRYRLYDIDRLINRTLVYATLTAVLGLGYAGAVLVLGSCSAASGSALPAGRWPAPPWPWPPSSNRRAAASNKQLTGASTAASTTPPRPSRRSPPACTTSLTWTPCRPSCWRSWTRPWSRPGSRCGFDPPQPAPRPHLTVRHGPPPGPTEG
jgi:hypothetical protein